MKGHKELEVLCQILEQEKEVWEKVTPEKEQKIHDWYFNYPDMTLRVRCIDGAYQLTYKTDVFKGKKWQYSNEYEVGTEKGILEILKQLGYKPTVEVNMIKYFCDGVEIQKVDGLGFFIEVEGKNRKECWKKIKETGISVSKELNTGKPEMIWNIKN